jgi:hypothetical protein
MTLFMFIFILHITSHSYSKFISHHLPRFFFFISSSPVSSVGKTSLGCRAENRTRAATRRTSNWATPHRVSYAAPQKELRRTLLGYAASCWATPHPFELRRTHSYSFTLLAVSTVHEGARQAWASYLVCSLFFAAWPCHYAAWIFAPFVRNFSWIRLWALIPSINQDLAWGVHSAFALNILTENTSVAFPGGRIIFIAYLPPTFLLLGLFIGPWTRFLVIYKMVSTMHENFFRKLGKFRGVTTWTGDFKCREVKTGFFRKRWMQTGSSGTLTGWKSCQTTFVPLWDRMEGAWLWTQEPRGISFVMYSMYNTEIWRHAVLCGKHFVSLLCIFSYALLHLSTPHPLATTRTKIDASTINKNLDHQKNDWYIYCIIFNTEGLNIISC